MALSLNLTLAGTSEVATFIINRIAFLEEDLADATTTLVGVESGEQTSRMRVVGAPAVVAAAIAAAAGIVVSGQPYAPLVQLTQTGDGARVWFQYATAVAVIDDATSGAQSYVETSGPDGRWRVTSTRAAVVTALVAAAAATPSPGGSVGSGRLVLQAFIDGVTGAILGTISDVGVTLAATSPYVSGSGFWLWTLGGTNVPSSYIVSSQVFSGQVSNMQSAQLGGPGSAQFYATSIAIDRILGTGKSDLNGNANSNWGTTVAFVSAGVYDITLDTAPPGGKFTLSAWVSDGSGADRDVSIAYPSATVARVTIATSAGVATSTPFSYVAIGADDSGSNGYQPTQPVYTMQVFSADA